VGVIEQFSLVGKVALVTGGQGLLGRMICDTVRELGGEAISVDIAKGADYRGDVSDNDFVSKLPSADILVNGAISHQQPIHSEPDVKWQQQLDVALTGARNMSLRFAYRGGKVILNIGSDLSLIAPDQSLYPEGQYKPLSYSVVKHGMVGMTRWFATRFPDMRCNCLCPGGIDTGQAVPRVPIGRLARLEEMKGPVAFLISSASSYMTGAVLSVDGGRTCC